MATYAFGAAYGGTDDKTRAFVNSGSAFIGWDPHDAPFLHAMLRQIEIGDLVFLKSAAPSVGLMVKAAGVVTDNTIRQDPDLGFGVAVDWAFTGEAGGGQNRLIGKLNDKADFMRGGTLYREFNPLVLRVVIDLIRGR